MTSDKNKLYITNTLTDRKELFVPQESQQVKLYVCGVTPYDYAHLGHGRCYVTFDLLFRLLQFLDYRVFYCRNFTDVDDKLINRAIKEFGDPHKYTQLATKFINAYHEDMHTLNCLPPTEEPRVTENITEIINFIEKLILAGKAYVADGDVYYNISSFAQYGKLSKRDLEELQAGARVTVREDKHNPLDFALWKKEAPENPAWKSPWGWGRPGWHIECSAMIRKYLGISIDIHAGGMDLIFPHHENEIAQSEGLFNQPLATYWMHNAFIIINKEKMSKSLGNFVSLRDVFEEFNPMVIRYYLLSHHYRNPLEFSVADIESYTKSYQRLAHFFANIAAQQIKLDEIHEWPIAQQLLDALCDDLNVAKLFGIIFDNFQKLAHDQEQIAVIKFLLQTVLGISFEPIRQEIIITPAIEQLLAQREKARQEKNWAKSDELREKLRELGYEPQDKKIG